MARRAPLVFRGFSSRLRAWRRVSRAACTAAALGLALPACGEDAGGAKAGAGGTADRDFYDGSLLLAECDPIGGHCGLPFPSNVYLVPDQTGRNPSGKAVHFGAATLPAARGGGHAPIEQYLQRDGFSVASGPMVFLPGATATGLADPSTIASTLDAASPTLLLDAATNELVAHFVDIDESARHDDQRVLMLRPVHLLEPGHRYIVAVRGVVDASGTPIEPTAVFRALRDGTPHSDPSVASRRALYANVFAHLEAAGVGREGLQVAWDFTTGTREGITGDALAMRDDALAAVGDEGPPFVVKSVVEAPSQHILRRILLTMTVPLFLESAEYASGGPPVEVVRDAAGRPKQAGTMDVDVLVNVPVSVTTGAPHGLLQNGHGLLGSKDEGVDGFLAQAADEYHYIQFAVDFFGFSSGDVGLVVEALSGRPELTATFVNRQVQGHINQLLAMRLMRGAVASRGIVAQDGTVLLQPAVIDPTVRAYRGDSQGGIMGGTYMTLSTDVTRGLLGEFGTPYGLLLNRSKDWSTYGAILGSAYADDIDVQLVLGLVQLAWDRSEPAGFVRYLAHDMLPGTPAHQVLLHAALGDHQVPTLGAHVMARTMGAKLLRSNDAAQPLVREVWGLEEAGAPLQGESALVEYDFNLAPEPLVNLPALDGCDPHDRVRELLPSFQQQDTFFRTGRIEWTCDGVCNCDNGTREEAGCAETRASQCP